MSIIPLLACSLNRRDEEPNELLAIQLVEQNNTAAVKELIDNLSNKDKNIPSDCIKVLDEIGKRKPELIAKYDAVFIDLFHHKNNRLIWGAMCTLDCIASLNPHQIYAHLPKILETADKGSVITKDHAMSILTKLAAIPQHTDEALALLLDYFRTCATNQLPMYAENAVAVITPSYKAECIRILQSRIPEIEKESKVKRVEMVMKKLGK